MTAPYRPTWLNPAQASMLSNKRGSNQTSDAISLTARHSHPSGDAPGLIRVIANRVVQAGVSAAPQQVWDSGWTGNVSTLALPYTTSVGGVTCPVGPNSVVTYGNRIYVLVADQHTVDTTHVAVIYSAAFSGTTVGAWRLETAPANDPSTTAGEVCAPGGLAVIGGYLYLLTNRTVWNCFIQGDGTLAGWQDQWYANPDFLSLYIPGNTPVLMAGYDATGWPSSGLVNLPWQNGGGKAMGFIFVFDSSGACFRYAVDNQDGDLEPTTLSGTDVYAPPTLPAARNYAAVHVDDSGYILVLGGETGGGTPQTTVYYATCNVKTNGNVGTWASSSTPLTAARSRMAYAARYVASSPRSGSGSPATIYIAGGIATSGGGAQSTIYSCAVNTLVGSASSWTTATNALSSAMKYGGAAVLNLGVDQDPPYAMSGTHGYMLLAGGGVTTPMLATTDDSSAVLSGVSSALSAGSLGTGASVVTNDDATVDVTFQWNGFGAAATAGLADGDEVQLAVETTDVATGDSSPLGVTTVRIGQAPTVTSLVPASSAVLTSGAPKLSWKYTPGAGGGQQVTWRARIFDTTNAVVYDSGLQYSLTNAVVPDLRPYLNQNGSTPWKVQIDVVSTDLPMAGASNAGTSSSTGLTYSATPPATPTGVSATPDTTNGWVTVAWTNPGGSSATSNRVWRRKTGTTAWELLKGGIVAVIGSQQSVNLMDQVAFQVAYDYTVSAADANLIGSPRATAVTNVTLNPNHTIDQGGYLAMLHVAGSGTAAGNAVGVYLRQPPTLPRTVDATSALGFGNSAPTTRYGPARYRTLKLALIDYNQAARDALQAFLDLVQTNGYTVCYRDRKGFVLYVGLDGAQDLTADIYYDEGLSLLEQQFVYAP